MPLKNCRITIMANAGTKFEELAQARALVLASQDLLFNLKQAVDLLSIYVPKDRSIPIVESTLRTSRDAIARAEGES